MVHIWWQERYNINRKEVDARHRQLFHGQVFQGAPGVLKAPGVDWA